jgi:hypothetical protein
MSFTCIAIVDVEDSPLTSDRPNRSPSIALPGDPEYLVTEYPEGFDDIWLIIAVIVDFLL